MDPVSNLAQAHAAAVLHHMMNGGMGAPGRAGLPSPYPIHQVGGPPPGTGVLFGQIHPGLLHLLGLGANPIGTNPMLPPGFVPPTGPPTYTGGPPTPFQPGSSPMSIKAWNA